MFVHCVYFWLSGEDRENRIGEMSADCQSLLTKIATVRHLWSGTPAMTQRDVVDNTYDVGLCVVFDDKAGYDVYASHPLHMQFVEKHRSAWQRIQVYDFEA